MQQVMLGGYRFEQLLGHPDKVNPDKLVQISFEALQSYLNIQSRPVHHLVSILKVCIWSIRIFTF